MKFFKDKKEILILLLFVAVGFLSLAFASQLPKDLSGDEVVILLSNKVAENPNFPDHDLLASVSFQSYLYPKLINFLHNNFSLETYRSILLFVYVFLTGYFSYLGLRLLKFSRKVAIAVSLIALMPRMSPGSTFFGVFTHYESLGRSLALPFIWLLAAYNIKLLLTKKKIWPMFLAAGILVYLHPVSMIFFSAILFLLSFVWIWKNESFKQALIKIIKSVVAFSVGAFFLLKEIVTTTASSVTKVGEVSATGVDYANALVYRMTWDFPPETILWLRHVAVVSFVFLVFIVGFLLLAKKKKIDISPIRKQIYYWSFALMFLSVFFSYLIPNLQLWLVRNYDFPFVVQQSSRIFKFYYLGLFIAFAASLDLFRKYFKNKLLFTFIVIIGIVSSSIGFEWSQYLLGYQNYQEEYILQSLQGPRGEDKLSRYQGICADIVEAGIGPEDLVISSDFDLRYFCEISIYTSFEEGTTYLMRGKESLVYWHQIFTEQAKVLDSNRAQDLLDFADKVDAQYAILKSDSAMLDELRESQLVVKENNNLAIIKFIE